MASARERAFRATIIKLGSFVVVMVLIFIALVVVFGQFRTGSSKDYKAYFTSASQMKSGSNVRIAGVVVGRVSGISVTRSNEAKVEFSVDDTYRLPKTTKAFVRYENLTGDRYLELQEGAGPDSGFIGDGGSIPVNQTQPALDLDKLLGGFKPLFNTLKPQEVNQLSMSLVQVFQGQGPALTKLLQQTAQFTNSLADRDQLIGSVIDNLNKTLGIFNDDKKNLDTSLDRLQQLVSGLDSQRDTIGSAIRNASDVTNDLAKVLTVNRPDMRSLITNTGKLSDQIIPAEGYVRGLLSRLPDDYLKLSNLGSYGGWLQVFICKVHIITSLPNGQEIWWKNVDDTEAKTKENGRCAPKK